MAYKESYMVRYGSSSMIYGNNFVDNTVQSNEYCLPNYSDGTYYLELSDQYGGGWSSGSFLEIKGEYGNTFYKGAVRMNGYESVQITIMYGIWMKTNWKFYGADPGNNWTATDFVDNAWIWESLSYTQRVVNGTQYFRNSFYAYSNAAYEINLRYKYGIVVYINSVEIARDNMPDGPVSYTTKASGSYSTLSMHSWIRNANDLSTQPFTVAIEIHLPVGITSSIIDLDLWMALLGSTVGDNWSCYVLPQVPTITASQGTNSFAAMDWNDYTFFSTDNTQPTTLTYVYNNIKLQVNGAQLFMSNNNAEGPTAYSLKSVINGTMSLLFMESGVYHESYSTKWSSSPFVTTSSNTFKFEMTASDVNYFALNEFRPAVCKLSIPSEMKYSPNYFSLFVSFESMTTKPTVTGFMNCTVEPTLPAGIVLDEMTCVISGMPTVVVAEKKYTISSAVGIGYNSVITIEAKGCEMSMLRLLRSYKTYASSEIFSITNAEGLIVYDEVKNSGQVANKDVYRHLCLPTGRYKLTVGSTSSSSAIYWYAESFLELFLVLNPTEFYQILRARMDNNLHLRTSYFFDTTFMVATSQSWNYKMGSLPVNWYNNDVTGWESAALGSYPMSSNQIQLYKKVFTAGSLIHASAFSISLRYAMGCVVYMNGHEVFRNRVTGDVTESTLATGSAFPAMYHTVTLPVTTFSTGDANTNAVNYLVEGANTIAVAIFGTVAANKESLFDAAVHLIDEESSSRVFSYIATSSGMSGYSKNIWNDYYGDQVYKDSTSCIENSISLKFDNDRREWIGAYSITNMYNSLKDKPNAFSLLARNPGEEWVELDVQRGWQFWDAGQEKKTYIRNNKPYNEYMFKNFKNEGPDCSWRVNRAALFTEKADLPVPTLTYNPISIFKDIEMAEEYPSSELYYNFKVTPDLPVGLILDPPSGVIMGRATVEDIDREYIISARKYNGADVTSNVTLGIKLCTGGQSLVTTVLRTDSYPVEVGYAIYKGRGVNGEVVREKTGLPSSSTLFYVDICAKHGLYTLKTIDTKNTGWATPSSFWLSVDVGNMVYDMGQMPSGTAPITATTTFSSFLPFQIVLDEWQVLKAENTPSDWTSVDYDDSTWTTTKAASIGSAIPVTIYVRRSFNMVNIDDYSLLNVRVRFNGGLVAFYNGRKVARFNLPEIVDATTEALNPHDSTVFSKFSIVLNTVGIVVGKNVMAFELHRAAGTSSQTNIEFDATGVFGVETCSVILNTYEYFNSTTTSSGPISNFFDMSPTTYVNLNNKVGSNVMWQFENLEAVRFNAYAFQPGSSVTSFGYSLHSRELEEDDWNEVDRRRSESMTQRLRKTMDAPGAMVGHRNYKFNIDDTASSTPSFYEFLMLYCKTSGPMCPGVDDYPPVSEGEKSPSVCPAGFIGYTYRLCKEGKLGGVKTEQCRYKIPSDLKYLSTKYTFVLDTKVTTGIPTYVNLITEFFFAVNVFLPLGLSLDSRTGEISGVPQVTQDLTTYTVYGKNERATTMVIINIQIRDGACPVEGFFERTKVGRVAQYDCSLQGSFVGTQKRACILGETDGEWQKITGFCMSIAMIIFMTIMAIIIIVLVILVLLRSMKRVKAIGGVKGKKAVKRIVKQDVVSKEVRV